MSVISVLSVFVNVCNWNNVICDKVSFQAFSQTSLSFYMLHVNICLDAYAPCACLMPLGTRGGC